MGKSSSRGRLLIVDDDYSICTMLAEKLSGEGYECDSCAEGEPALDLMQRHAYDAIVLDLMMPGISGLEILMTARKAHPQAAFIIVTGIDDMKLAEQALKQGADAYLVKPIQLEKLVVSVAREIETKRRQGAAPPAQD
jgi:DNA-binding response OmpR family regulator